MALRMLTKLQAPDGILNRIQDQLLEILNPALRYLYSFPPRFTSADRPSPSAEVSGKMIRVKDAGKPEELQICLQRSTGVFEWVSVSVASY